jgi:hypothetical protein
VPGCKTGSNPEPEKINQPQRGKTPRYGGLKWQNVTFIGRKHPINCNPKKISGVKTWK